MESWRLETFPIQHLHHRWGVWVDGNLSLFGDAWPINWLICGLLAIKILLSGQCNGLHLR